MKLLYPNIAKKLLLFSLLFCQMKSVMAINYYVSNNGNDSNSGLTAESPWQSLTKVNSITFKAGDQILFQRGNIFYGTLSISQSGTSDNPILYSAYGTGLNPVITGFTTVSGWTNLGNNIWESSNAVSALPVCNMVTVNGVYTAMGRFPNENTPDKGYLFFDAFSGGTSITSSSLLGKQWVGAEAVFRARQYSFFRRTITTQSGGVIGWSGEVPLEEVGKPFFIQNSIQTLDQQNEWYYNPATKKISIYSPGQPVNVRVASVDKLVSIGNAVKYIIIDNLSFSGANVNAIYRWPFGSEAERAKYITIKNCNISFSGEDAIFVKIDYLNIENNAISNSNGNGILADASKNIVIRSNTITNTANYKGMTQGSGSSSALRICNVVNALVEYNRITNCGYNGINFSLLGTDLVTIRYNYIDSFCTVLNDGGGIYGNRNAKILNNIVLNGAIGQIRIGRYDPFAIGIYLDDNSQNMEVSGNTVSGCDRIGIYLHNTSNSKVDNNLCYDNKFWQLLTRDDVNAGKVEKNIITNNIFISKSDNYRTVEYNWGDGSAATIGTLNNNYYCRPKNEGSEIYSNNQRLTVAQWQKMSGQDANSYGSAQDISNESDMQLYYNDTKTNKAISLSQPMIDVKGNKYVGNITLPPYTSTVLMKDNNPTEITSFSLPGQIGNTIIDSKRKVIEITMPYGISLDNISAVFTLSSGATAKVNTMLQVSGTTTNNFNSHMMYVVTAQDGVTSKTWTVSVITTQQTIDLKAGWNIVSFNVLPSYTDFMIIFQPLSQSGVLIKIQDEEGHFMVNTPDGWYSNLGPLDTRKGYNVKVSANTKLTVKGLPASINMDIPLNSGFNIIGYPLTKSTEALTSFQRLIADGSLVKVQDETGKSIIMSENGWLCTIDSMLPGKGYYVNVNKNTSLNFGSFNNNNTAGNEALQSSTYFRKSYSGNPYLSMSFVIRNLSKSNLKLKIGDEIGIFDRDSCVGNFIYDGSDIAGFSAGMKDTPLQLNGFTQGDTIKFRIWKSAEQTLLENLTAIYLNNSPFVFTPMGTTIIELQRQLVTTLPVTKEILNICSYPNPFVDYVNFEFKLEKKTSVALEIYDLQGKKIAVIANQLFEAGLHTLAWDGGNQSGSKVSPGMYICLYRTGNDTIYKKIICEKF